MCDLLSQDTSVPTNLYPLCALHFSISQTGPVQLHSAGHSEQQVQWQGHSAPDGWSELGTATLNEREHETGSLRSILELNHPAHSSPKWEQRWWLAALCLFGEGCMHDWAWMAWLWVGGNSTQRDWAGRAEVAMISCHTRWVIVPWDAKDILYLIVHWPHGSQRLILSQPETFIHIISLLFQLKPNGKSPCTALLSFWLLGQWWSAKSFWLCKVVWISPEGCEVV